VNVALVTKGLGDQADDEAYNQAVVLCHKAGGTKMNKKQFWEHQRHPPSTPQFVNSTDDRLVVVNFRVTDHRLIHFFAHSFSRGVMPSRGNLRLVRHLPISVKNNCPAARGECLVRLV
jgi:hypothetical protein